MRSYLVEKRSSVSFRLLALGENNLFLGQMKLNGSLTRSIFEVGTAHKYTNILFL